jgi:Bacterial Ig domain/IPT/TIG domain
MRRRLTVDELDARLLPTFYGNQLFPLDNPWNQVIAYAPVAANSGAIIGAIVNRHGGTAPRIHADWGNPLDGNLYGIPVNVVDSTVPKVAVLIAPDGYGDESDNVLVPIPANAVIEGDGPTGPSDPTDPSARGDSHLLVYDRDANVLYELGSAARPNETSYPYGGDKPPGAWGAWQVSFWDLNTNYFRTIRATSADAAGLPILPGLVRPDEANPISTGGVGVIDHAIRVTMVRTRDEFTFPASHEASSRPDADLPRMGERFRLKANFVIPDTWSPEAKAIAQAMKTYGLIVADNGSDFFFQGTPSDQWDMDAVLQVQSIRATDFEVVDLTPRVTGLSVHSGDSAGGTAVTITGYNFGGGAGELHVRFGDAEAASVTVLSDTQLVAIAPVHAAGTVDVRVVSGSMRPDTDGNQVFFGCGTSRVVKAGKFAFGTLPTANADAYTVLHDRDLSVGATLGVRANDSSSPAGHPLTVSLLSAPTHGTLTLYANGSFIYRPAAGFVGSDSFTYRAKDGLFESAPATVTLTVTDQAPVAANDAYKTAKGRALTVLARGVLSNDTDADKDALRAVAVSPPVNGTLKLYASGAFTYIPNPSFVGVDTFTYKANDKALDSALTTVSITVPAPPRVTSIVFNDGSVQRSLIRSITVTFDTLVTLDPGAFSLVRAGGIVPTLTRQVTQVGGVTQVVLTFRGTGTQFGSLADGNWTLKVVRTRVHRADYRPAIMEEPAVTAFHRLFGDADGDRDVEAEDQIAFEAAVGQTDGLSLATFDFDRDGNVDAADRTRFNRRFGRVI